MFFYGGWVLPPFHTDWSLLKLRVAPFSDSLFVLIGRTVVIIAQRRRGDRGELSVNNLKGGPL
jgi:hypothetical protein